MKKRKIFRKLSVWAARILTVVLLTSCSSGKVSSSGENQSGQAGQSPGVHLSGETKPSAGTHLTGELKPTSGANGANLSGETKPSAGTAPAASAQQSAGLPDLTDSLPSEMLCCGLPSAFERSSVPAPGSRAWADINDDVPFFTEKEMEAARSMAAAAGDKSGRPRGYQVYGPLDRLGRCTGACALVGTETLPQEGRGDISSVKPTGWHTVTYDEIEGDYLFNRCHLIGFQLTGQNINEQNLITGTRYMNIEGMLPYEESVLAYVRGTGNHVLYRVSPVFDGDNLLAAGVLMEASSVEDPIVRFCAFCFNVQPGIEIDYADGESRRAAEPADRTVNANLPGDTPGQMSGKTAGVPADQSGITPGNTGSSNNRSWKEWDYIVNVKSRIFHRPDCESVDKMREKNRQGFCGTREELTENGYKPCKNCRP